MDSPDSHSKTAISHTRLEAVFFFFPRMQDLCLKTVMCASVHWVMTPEGAPIQKVKIVPVKRMWAPDEGLTHGSTQFKWLLDAVFNTKISCFFVFLFASVVFVYVPQWLLISAMHV